VIAQDLDQGPAIFHFDALRDAVYIQPDRAARYGWRCGTGHGSRLPLRLLRLHGGDRRGHHQGCTGRFQKLAAGSPLFFAALDFAHRALPFEGIRIATTSNVDTSTRPRKGAPKWE
jgi:hypothetical protein